MTLTTDGKNYIAQNFGVGDCFVASGLTWTAVALDNSTAEESGGTKNIIGRLATTNMYKAIQLKTPRTGTFTYAMVKSANNNTDFNLMVDAAWIGDNDGSPIGETQYCYAAATVCTPGAKRCKNSTTIEQCKADGSGWQDLPACGTGYICQGGVCVEEPDKPTTGPLEVYVGGGASCDPGAPSVDLDTTNAFAFFKTDPHEYIGVGGIQVHNKSSVCRAYFAWEVRVWDGYGFVTCPTSAPEHQEISRYLAEATGRPLSLTRLDASGTEVVWGSFEVPPTMVGEKTICLSLWGNFDRDALIAELNAVGYTDLP